ncbi:hypothetical protein Bbelb_005940 [Branchiostoma belcheri]|nr:hypothetical protein Bbelb_005940 [Branchiostoma belcheri]
MSVWWESIGSRDTCEGFQAEGWRHAIKEQLDTLEPQVRSAHERKGAAISQVAPSERKNIENAMSNLKVEWDKVNKAYVDRYSRFKKSLAHWQQFHCDMRDLTSWLNEAERTVQDTKAPGGDLDLEKARAQQKQGCERRDGVASRSLSCKSDDCSRTCFPSQGRESTGTVLRGCLGKSYASFQTLFSLGCVRRLRSGIGYRCEGVLPTLPSHLLTLWKAGIVKLQDGIENHRKQVEGLNANGQEIIEQCTSIDATLLREKLDGLNRRWRVLCAEVNDRKESVSCATGCRALTN